MSIEYRLDLGMKDLMAILFRRSKRCLNCNSSVIRKVEKTETEKGWKTDRQGQNIDIGYAQKYIIRVMYVCDTCGKSYLPREFW